MDWEAFEKHKAFAGEKKQSMMRRRVGHDYESRRMYLITMTVEGRRPILGTLVGSADAPEGSPEEPRVLPTPLGEEVERCWQAIASYYPEVRVLALQLMPDHLHGILFVTRQMEQHLGMVLKGFKAGCNKAYRQLGYAATMLRQRGQANGPANGKANGQTNGPANGQTNAQAKLYIERRPGFLFARNYNDHILEGAGELERWFNYLHENPRRLAVKRQKPEFFTVRHQISIGEWSCQAVGNRFLLTVPERAAVIVHGAWSDAEYAEKKEGWLALAERGGVLISAAVSTREKEVMRDAMNRGYRLIYLRENGFPELYKPSGESFTACSEGRLLMVSPWDYHAQRKTISREQCLQLNRLAEMIASEDRWNK